MEQIKNKELLLQLQSYYENITRKPILVIYLDVRQSKDKNKEIKEFQKSLDNNSELNSDYLIFIIPSYENSKVELLNPVFLDSDEYEKLKDKADIQKMKLLLKLK